MIRRMSLIAMVLVCFSLILSPAYAGKGDATIHGKVTEVIEAAGYTYVEMDTGTERVWAAGPNTLVKVGDNIGFATDMPMANFHSKSLKRDFAIIYFVDGYITGNNTVSASAQPLPEPMGKPVPGIKPLKGGQTIAEVHNDKQRLKGKIIRVRGLVTKFTPAIMGKNWVHIMDSSSQYDLTMTTTGTAAADDVVIIEGRVTLDRDFGYGYFYPLIIEDGKVTKE